MDKTPSTTRSAGLGLPSGLSLRVEDRAEDGAGRERRDAPRRLRTAAIYGGFLIAGICMVCCGADDKKGQPAAAAPPVVIVAKAEQREVVPYEIRTGTLEANQTVTILPRVSAFVESIPFRPGEFVKANTVLFTLDKKPFQSQFDQAKGTLAVRKSDVDVATAQLAVAKANLQNANDELGRQERLEKQQATNEKDLMNARNNQRAAAASVDSATAALASAKAAVEAATAAVGAAQVNVDYCTIATPMAGKVDTNNVNVGDLVGPVGQKPLTTVREIDPLKANFTLPEDFINNYLKTHPVQPGRQLAMPVTLSLGAEYDFRYEATLNFVSNTVDPSTGTVAAQAMVKNVDMRLYPGLYIRVKVDLAPLKDAVLVREDALSRDIGGDYVWVISADGTAEKRYIKLGTLVESMRVVQSGLKADETYVVQGIARVRDRAKVTPKLEAAPTTKPA